MGVECCALPVALFLFCLSDCPYVYFSFSCIRRPYGDDGPWGVLFRWSSVVCSFGLPGILLGRYFVLCRWRVRVVTGRAPAGEGGAGRLICGGGSPFGCRVRRVCVLGEDWGGCCWALLLGHGRRACLHDPPA